jgi:hypothetical protein
VSFGQLWKLSNLLRLPSFMHVGWFSCLGIKSPLYLD